MNIKPVIFFIILFGILIFGYFQYNTFIQYFPIHILISSVLLIVGILTVFFPDVMQKFKEGEDCENIKEFIIEKYKRK